VPGRRTIPRNSVARSSKLRGEAGFTLVELVVVLVLIGLLGSLGYSRVDSVLQFKQKENLRDFANTWEFLFQYSLARGESYRLVLDLDENYYQVLREIPAKPGEVVEVDLLKNLRTRREQERREKEETETLITDEQQQQLEQEAQTGDLSEQFFHMVFSDPNRSFKLAPPEEFPELADANYFVAGLEIKDFKNGVDTLEEGKTFIRFSPRGASQFALVHFTVDESNFTLFMNPSSGKVSIENEYKDYEWTYGQNDESGK